MEGGFVEEVNPHGDLAAGADGGGEDGPTAALMDGCGIVDKEAAIGAGGGQIDGLIEIGLMGNRADEIEGGVEIGQGTQLFEIVGQGVVKGVIEQHSASDVVKAHGAGIRR